jgi:hypothetical protein
MAPKGSSHTSPSSRAASSARLGVIAEYSSTRMEPDTAMFAPGVLLLLLLLSLAACSKCLVLVSAAGLVASLHTAAAPP